MNATSRGARAFLRRAAAVLTFAAAGLGAATAAHARYQLHYGWTPRPHFPATLVGPAPQPNTWVFKTRWSPVLIVRPHNFELRVNWDRRDTEEWNFPRIFRQMLRLGCDIVDPDLAKQLIDRLYATRSLVPPRDLGARGVAILHRLSTYQNGCVIWMQARGARLHELRIVVAPPRPHKRTQ
jgi:hypothetical protein